MDLKMLDVVIGVVFFYTFASLMCTTLRELIEAVLRTRARMLEVALRELLNDKTPASQDGKKSILLRFYEHPLIDSLFPGDYSAASLANGGGGKLAQIYGSISKPIKAISRYLFSNRNLPSYIPPDHFAAALLDVMTPRAVQSTDRQNFQAIRSEVNSACSSKSASQKDNTFVENTRLRDAVLWALDNSNEDIDKARALLSKWFDNSMMRVSGWYKRRTQAYLFVIGIGVAFAFNMNTLDVVQKLYRDDASRAAIVSAATTIGTQATNVAQRPDTGQSATSAGQPTSQAAATPATPGAGGASSGGDVAKAAKDALDKLQSLKDALGEVGYPVGWTKKAWNDFVALFDSQQQDGSERNGLIAWHVSGWLLTAIAMTLGSTFWFDLLNKLVSLRSSFKPPSTAAPDSSEPGDKATKSLVELLRKTAESTKSNAETTQQLALAMREGQLQQNNSQV